MDRDSRSLYEQRTPCGERKCRRELFGMLGKIRGTPRWADYPVRGKTGWPEMSREDEKKCVSPSGGHRAAKREGGEGNKLYK